MNRHFTKTFLMSVKPFVIAVGHVEGVQKSIRSVHACVESVGGLLRICCGRWLCNNNSAVIKFWT